MCSRETLLESLYQCGAWRSPYVVGLRLALEGDAAETHDATVLAELIADHGLNALNDPLRERLVQGAACIDEAGLIVVLGQGVMKDVGSFSRHGPPTRPGLAIDVLGYPAFPALMTSRASSPSASHMRATSLPNEKVRSR